MNYTQLIPDRWVNCPRVGNPINDTFIAFKTPLKESYKMNSINQWTINSLMQIGEFYNTKINLIIDLTKTSRYYDKDELNSYNCKYFKMACDGHGQPPSEKNVKDFNNIVTNFIKNDSGLIGVHCTHGYNRSGFLIVCYLVQMENYTLHDALEMFKRCRVNGIYKQDYIEKLKLLFSPKLEYNVNIPDWSTKQQEPNKPELDFMNGLLPSVKTVTDPQEIEKVKEKINELIGRKQITFPGSQAVCIDRMTFQLLMKEPYMVTWKADGIRYMILILDETKVYFIDRKYKIFHTPNLKFFADSQKLKPLTNTLVDAEMVIDTFKIPESKKSQVVVRALIYDVLCYENENVMEKDLYERLNIIKDKIILNRSVLAKKGHFNSSKEHIRVRAKQFFHLNQTETLLKEFMPALCHETDGLIFQPINCKYILGKCDKVLKWKSLEQNTIDFKLVIEIDKQTAGKISETKAKLMCGGTNKIYGYLPLTPEVYKLNNKIIECNYDFVKKQWKFLRERTDKLLPNYVSTAENIIKSIEKPITEKMLLQYIHYLTQEKSKKHNPDQKDTVIIDTKKRKS
ncbi:GTP--RNA guanylyltransferase [Intoshia linei]|uniref:mRNA-capping enzyme n=1 Tax=Intoshia linei TaxID=1819745 RepID=A0A177BD07_9BILA|nr:GTP--RNA guanylyltransferase [Intoshia linei]